MKQFRREILSFGLITTLTLLAIVGGWYFARSLSQSDTSRFERGNRLVIQPDVPEFGHLAWSPDGQSFIVTSATTPGTIWRVALDGSTAQQITDGQIDALSASVSPVGSHIAFLGASDGRLDLWLMDADGTNRQNLTRDFASMADRFAWSPDGQFLAVAAVARHAAHSSIWQIAIADGSASQMTPTGQVSYIQPRWHADGDRIVTVALQGVSFASLSTDAFVEDEAAIEVYALGSRGAVARVEGPFIQPQWMVDGERIVAGYFCGDDPSLGVDIVQVNMADGSIESLTEGRCTLLAGDTHIQQSPDGAWLLYEQTEALRDIRDVVALEIARPVPFNLTADAKADIRNPRYSPDGSTIAFLLDFEIWLMPSP